MTGRKAEKAGIWYAGTARELAREVDACIARGKADYGGAGNDAAAAPVAIVAPHAGLAYSGPLAAAAFTVIRERMDPVGTFIVFGASHRAQAAQPAVWTDGPWETPLGEIEIDYALADALIQNGVGTANSRPHFGDNAIELQTPFIKRMFPEARMVPVAVSFIPSAWRLGELAAAVAVEHGGTVVAVASTDLTHYGAAFDVMPAGVGQPAIDWTRRNDDRFLDTLVNMRLDDIVPVAKRDGSACGAGAAAAAAGWARARGCSRGRLLAHTNSYEINPTGVADHLVGYAALVYERDDK